MQMTKHFSQILIQPEEFLLHSLEESVISIGLNVNTNKIQFMCFKQKGALSTLKLVDHFTYLSTNISSTESNVNIRLVKA